MQFDEFDKKSRDAAEHHHPAYDEKAWTKMERLLDKHMPVDKDRRRIFFLLILLFLGLGSVGLIILKPWKNSSPLAVEKAGENTTVRKTELHPVQDPAATPELETRNDQPTVQPSLTRPPAKELSKTSVQPASKTQTKLPVTQKEMLSQSDKQNEVKSNIITQPVPEEKNSESILSNKKLNADDPFSLKPDKKTEPVRVQDITASVAAVETSATTAAPVQAKNAKKVKNKKQHAIFISFSGGPDRSFVHDNAAGTIKLFGGAGIGYTYNNRITIRTGFYSGRKIYSSGPDGYKPPPGFYAYYPYLEKVDANCEIYELPVYLSYQFGKSSRQNFFASAGLSSYIMKEEQYKYYYKYSQNGPTLSKTRTIRDINQHQLAGLTLSAGYNKRITRHISLTAEPYVKIPLKGVGYGKVKLNSAGVSMSVNVNPFAKKTN